MIAYRYGALQQPLTLKGIELNANANFSLLKNGKLPAIATIMVRKNFIDSYEGQILNVAGINSVLDEILVAPDGLAGRFNENAPYKMSRKAAWRAIELFCTKQQLKFN
jgi:hypothetical protein